MASGDFIPVVLSASTNGRPIAVAATASAGTTIHTAVSGTTDYDYVTLWASNIDTATRTLTLEWGGTGTSDQLGPVSLAANRGLVLVADRLPLRNSLVIKAYSDSANKVNIVGMVQRFEG